MQTSIAETLPQCHPYERAEGQKQMLHSITTIYSPVRSIYVQYILFWVEWCSFNTKLRRFGLFKTLRKGEKTEKVNSSSLPSLCHL